MFTVLTWQILSFDDACSGYLVSGDHLLGSHEKVDGRRETKLTVFIWVLNTRIVPADVPMKTAPK